MKPGDVLTGASGKTVEVINTDAEGRLILGDGLWYARELGATHLVDVATLTGACVVALGKVASGLFGQPDEWVDAVRSTSPAAPATAAGRCRSTTNTPNSCGARSPTSSIPAAARPVPAPRRCSSRNSPADCPGPISTSPARRGRTRRSRISRREPPASPSVRSRSWRWVRTSGGKRTERRAGAATRQVMCSASESETESELVARPQKVHPDQTPPNRAPSTAAVISSSRSARRRR